MSLATEAERADFARRLDEAQAELYGGQGVEAVRVIAHLVNIGNVEDARQACMYDWDKLADLPKVGEILAKELIPNEVAAFTKFRIRIEQEA